MKTRLAARNEERPVGVYEDCPDGQDEELAVRVDGGGASHSICGESRNLHLRPVGRSSYTATRVGVPTGSPPAVLHIRRKPFFMHAEGMHFIFYEAQGWRLA